MRSASPCGERSRARPPTPRALPARSKIWLFASSTAIWLRCIWLNPAIDTGNDSRIAYIGSVGALARGGSADAPVPVAPPTTRCAAADAMKPPVSENPSVCV
jgi:hypothetical protein